MEQTIERAQKRVEAAKLREEAAGIRHNSASHQRHIEALNRAGAKPTFDGQREGCLSKANKLQSVIGELHAKASRLEAEADLLEIT